MRRVFANLTPVDIPWDGAGSVERVVPWGALQVDPGTTSFATLQPDGTVTLNEPGLYLVDFHAEFSLGFAGSAPVGDFDVGAVLKPPTVIIS